MVVLVLAVVAGAVAGMVTGGRLAALTRFRLRAWPLVVAALVAELSLGALPAGLRWLVAAAGSSAVVVWTLRNRRGAAGKAPLDLIAAGTTLNIIAMAANGGMPVSRWALHHAGLGGHFDVAHGHLYKHVAMTAATHLRALGDVIPLAPARMVLSAGDVLMLVGVALLVRAGTRCPEPGLGAATIGLPGRRPAPETPATP